jgi:Protein of unknown function (DUF4019)
MRFAQLLLSLALVALFLPQTLLSQAQQKPEELAQKAAEPWLVLTDSGRYAESWDQASAAFKVAITREKWVDALNSVRTPLGKVVSRKLAAADYKNSPPNAPAGEYVVLRYDTSFENRKESTEIVSFTLDKDGKWRAAGYFIK